MYIQDRFDSYRSIEWTKTDWNCTSRRQRIDKVDISTPVAIDQRVANCLEETVRSFTSMRSSCRSSHVDVTFRCPLSVLQVVRCSSVHCFQTRLTGELFRCTQAPISRYENPPSRRPIIIPHSNYISCWNSFLFRCGGILRSY
ncbi:uncharacterized protein TNCV_681941 [Trichonephila clavipes]|nr:uncharacterized protein TNCV_681941 [Trichonephila clavipes]